MIIVGLTGGISHGKTSFASLLTKQARRAVHFETWELVAEVAAALRGDNPIHPPANDITAINRWLLPLSDIVAQCMHVSIPYDTIKLTDQKLQDHPAHYVKLFDYLRAVEQDPALATTEITAESKQTFRALLQWLGGFLVLNGGTGVWYDEIVRRVTRLQTQGCDLVTICGVRFPSDAERLRNAGGIIIQIDRPDLPQQDAQDITERERELITPDAMVTNNGNLEQLESCAEQVYADLCRRALAASYQAQKTTVAAPLTAASN